MSVEAEVEIREALEAIFKRYNKRGYLTLYLDEGDRVKIVGNVGLEALSPLIFKYLSQKLGGR